MACRPVSLSGPGQLCFLVQVTLDLSVSHPFFLFVPAKGEQRSLFQGHFVDVSSRRCLGVTARGVQQLHLLLCKRVHCFVIVDKDVLFFPLSRLPPHRNRASCHGRTVLLLSG